MAATIIALTLGAALCLTGLSLLWPSRNWRGGLAAMDPGDALFVIWLLIAGALLIVRQFY